MITKKILKIYKKYNGDIDSWARFGSLEEKEIMSDDNWYQIDSLIQEVVIAHSNLTQKLKNLTEEKEVIDEIIMIAKKEYDI